MNTTRSTASAPIPSFPNSGDLTDPQLAGQRLMLGFEGTEFSPDLRHVIEALSVGGVILFSANLASPEKIRSLCRKAQRHARECGLPPLLIAVDQEGGAVARLEPPFTVFAGNPSMRGEEDARHFARVTAAELSRVGINMNMAPVLDLAAPGGSSVMASRAFGNDPEWVARLGAVVIEGLQSSGVMAVAKHFPGIGRTRLDSHIDLPVLDEDPRRLETADFVPFRKAMSLGVAGVMLSHIVYRRLDEQWPASLSVRIARDMLRGEMGYPGVVMTDDLDMGAIRGRYPLAQVVRQTLEAEVDLLLICHRGPDREGAFEMIRSDLQRSNAHRRRAQASVERILNLKRRFLS